MAAKAATSTFAKFFPVEVYPVAAPVALVAGLFSYMMTKTFVTDVDTRLSPAMDIDCKKARAYGEKMRTNIRNLFDDRIKNGDFSIFKNEMAIRRTPMA